MNYPAESYEVSRLSFPQSLSLLVRDRGNPSLQKGKDSGQAGMTKEMKTIETPKQSFEEFFD
ncbi:MAG TPA: hypothetical protein ENH40_00155 [Nitrospirae bacterium]|nr:hypothetical protein [Nitrospirota bacterium]